MTVIDSYRDTEGSKELITRSINQYRDVYELCPKVGDGLIRRRFEFV